MARYVTQPSEDVAVSAYNSRCIYSTPGSYTFTVPTGVTAVKAIAVGGGGPGSAICTGGCKYTTWYQVCMGAYFSCVCRTSGVSTCCNNVYVVYGNLVPSVPACVGAWKGSACGACTGAFGGSSYPYVCDSATTPIWCAKAYHNTILNPGQTCAYGGCVIGDMVTPYAYNKQLYFYSGSGGGYAEKTISVTPAQTICVTVGGPGQTSSFGCYISATGGGTPTIVYECPECDGFVKFTRRIPTTCHNDLLLKQCHATQNTNGCMYWKVNYVCDWGIRGDSRRVCCSINANQGDHFTECCAYLGGIIANHYSYLLDCNCCDYTTCRDGCCCNYCFVNTNNIEIVYQKNVVKCIIANPGCGIGGSVNYIGGCGVLGTATDFCVCSASSFMGQAHVTADCTAIGTPLMQSLPFVCSTVCGSNYIRDGNEWWICGAAWMYNASSMHTSYNCCGRYIPCCTVGCCGCQWKTWAEPIVDHCNNIIDSINYGVSDCRCKYYYNAADGQSPVYNVPFFYCLAHPSQATMLAQVSGAGAGNPSGNGGNGGVNCYNPYARYKSCLGYYCDPYIACQQYGMRHMVCTTRNTMMPDVAWFWNKNNVYGCTCLTTTMYETSCYPCISSWEVGSDDHSLMTTMQAVTLKSLVGYTGGIPFLACAYERALCYSCCGCSQCFVTTTPLVNCCTPAFCAVSCQYINCCYPAVSCINCVYGTFNSIVSISACYCIEPGRFAGGFCNISSGPDYCCWCLRTDDVNDCCVTATYGIIKQQINAYGSQCCYWKAQFGNNYEDIIGCVVGIAKCRCSEFCAIVNQAFCCISNAFCCAFDRVANRCFSADTNRYTASCIGQCACTYISICHSQCTALQTSEEWFAANKARQLLVINSSNPCCNINYWCYCCTDRCYSTVNQQVCFNKYVGWCQAKVGYLACWCTCLCNPVNFQEPLYAYKRSLAPSLICVVPGSAGGPGGSGNPPYYTGPISFGYAYVGAPGSAACVTCNYTTQRDGAGYSNYEIDLIMNCFGGYPYKWWSKCVSCCGDVCDREWQFCSAQAAPCGTPVCFMCCENLTFACFFKNTKSPTFTVSSTFCTGATVITAGNVTECFNISCLNGNNTRNLQLKDIGVTRTIGHYFCSWCSYMTTGYYNAWTSYDGFKLPANGGIGGTELPYVYNTTTASTTCRGVYLSDPTKSVCSDYDQYLYESADVTPSLPGGKVLTRNDITCTWTPTTPIGGSQGTRAICVCLCNPLNSVYPDTNAPYSGGVWPNGPAGAGGGGTVCNLGGAGLVAVYWNQ